MCTVFALMASVACHSYLGKFCERAGIMVEQTSHNLNCTFFATPPVMTVYINTTSPFSALLKSSLSITDFLIDFFNFSVITPVQPTVFSAIHKLFFGSLPCIMYVEQLLFHTLRDVIYQNYYYIMSISLYLCLVLINF